MEGKIDAISSVANKLAEKFDDLNQIIDFSNEYDCRIAVFLDREIDFNTRKIESECNPEDYRLPYVYVYFVTGKDITDVKDETLREMMEESFQGICA